MCFWLLCGGSCPSEIDTQADGKFLSFFVCSGKFLGDSKFFIYSWFLGIANSVFSVAASRGLLYIRNCYREE